jgi:hypothetical protein
MNSSYFVRITVLSGILVIFSCLIVLAQFSGVGTTGTTAGSGRGTGSAGVMTGTGPDVSVPGPAYRTSRSDTKNVTATTSEAATERETKHRTISHTAHQTRKTSKHSHSSTAASPSPSP